MNEELIERSRDPGIRAAAGGRAPSGGPLGAAAARIANVALTAQVQFAYNCALAARDSAARAADYIETAWPETPLRSLVVAAYRTQLRKSDDTARRILEHARERCGLAFARIGV